MNSSFFLFPQPHRYLLLILKAAPYKHAFSDFASLFVSIGLFLTMLCAFALTLDAGKENPEYGNDSMAGVLLVAVTGTVFFVNCFVLMPLSTYKTFHGRYPSWKGKNVEVGKDGGQGSVVGGSRNKKTKVAPAKELNDVKSWGRR
jgi:hypothetical protein